MGPAARRRPRGPDLDPDVQPLPRDPHGRGRGELARPRPARRSATGWRTPGDVCRLGWTRLPPAARPCRAARSGERASCEIDGGPLRGVRCPWPGPAACRPRIARGAARRGADPGRACARAAGCSVQRCRAARSGSPSSARTCRARPLPRRGLGDRRPRGHRAARRGRSALGVLRRAAGAGRAAPGRSPTRATPSTNGSSALPRIRWAARSRVVPDAEASGRRRSRAACPTTWCCSTTTPPRRPQASRQRSRCVIGRAGADRGRRGRRRPERLPRGRRRPGARRLGRAPVDGEPCAVVPGNHAFAAVPVPPGSHRVVLAYTAPGLAAGSWSRRLRLCGGPAALAVVASSARVRASAGARAASYPEASAGRLGPPGRPACEVVR